MIGEFRIAKGWRVFVYIFSPLLIALFLFGGFIGLTLVPSSLIMSLILIAVSLGGIIIFVYALADTIKARLIITDNSISCINVLGCRTLNFQEIKGFRANDHYIHIVSSQDGKKSIKVSAYIERSGEVVEWLVNNFIALDLQDTYDEEQQILADNEFGITTQAREYRLVEARRVAKYINIIGGVICLWILFYPRPYLISVTIGMILPIIAFGALYVYRGLIRFDEKKNSAYPSISYGFIAPSIALFLRALSDYEILAYKNLWVAICVFSVTLTVVAVLGTKEVGFKKLIDYVTIFSVAAMILCYAFGTYVISNCILDKSEPEIFNSVVIDKEVSSGKMTTYYLTLKPWGPRTETEKVSVAEDDYDTTEKGDTVDIYLRPGLFKTPWFYVVTE